MIDEQLTSDTAPVPLRVLACWTESSVWQLRRSLRKLIGNSQLALDECKLADLGKHLRRSGYYHIFVTTVEYFSMLSPERRIQYARMVNLVCLMPGIVQQWQINDFFVAALAGLVFQEDLSFEQATDFLKSFCATLIGQNGIVDSATKAWQEMFPQKRPPILYLAREDGSIWPPKADPVTRNIISNLPDGVGDNWASPGSGIQSIVHIGHADRVINTQEYKEIIGDSIDIKREGQSPHNVQTEVGGDQISISHFDRPPINISQTAGGDQVNINRINSSTENLGQSFQQDQINLNDQDKDKALLRCRHCDSKINYGSKFCDQCGEPL